MYYHPFILPFLVGVIILFAIIIFKFLKWVNELDRKQKHFVKKNWFSLKTLSAVKEVFTEALLHINIIKKNYLLGYMHASLAFAWFLLIIVGKLESSIYAGTFFEEPWLGIFFKFFITEKHDYFFASGFSFIMDFLLLIVLSGLALAIIKRFKSRLLGVKKATKHTYHDKIALTSLWLIFPLRFLAESTTSAIHSNGGFLTGSMGTAITSMPVELMETPIWWAYSFSLFFFFVSLPFSRYMHIPTEIVYIFFKNWGVNAGEDYSGYTEVQLNSCSRCGLCIDVCQLNTAANINNVQSVYFIRDTRQKKLTDYVANNCLMCGRCTEACPVNLELTTIRQQYRNKKEIPGKHYFDYAEKNTNKTNYDVIYFAGCMTHLSPGIINSMKKIFKNAGIKYLFLDEEKGVCCGRPMRQQGFVQQYKDLISKNMRMIQSSGAKLLVCSCPICYKSFTEEYVLDIPVMHHSQYIELLAQSSKIKLKSKDISVVYHDPCELGRGAGIYNQPRKLLSRIAKLQKIESEKENALCCGGSLANAIIELKDQIKVRDEALAELNQSNPDYLITSCPLCKKAFIHGNKTEVKDIAEIVAENITNKLKLSKDYVKDFEKELINN